MNPHCYVIFTEQGVTKALNLQTGAIDFTNTTDSRVLEMCIAYLAPGGVAVFVKAESAIGKETEK